MSAILTDDELQAITGYKRPQDRVAELHRQGFYRARRAPSDGSVILERAHYDAVLSRREDEQRIALYESTRQEPVPYVHWRHRPEHQARVEAERQRNAEIDADRERQRLEVEAAAPALEAAFRERSKMNRMALVRHHAGKRRTAKLQRTPPWADLEAIRLIYKEAARLECETGIAHHVDHFYPLQGYLVSGLHVETNLQILTAAENIRKSNDFEVEA